MAVFVINEWLWSDVPGHNGPHNQREGFKVIVKLSTSQHKIVVVEGSAFDQKAWKLCKSTATNPMLVQRIVGALYVPTLRQNSDRCLLLKQEALPAIPPELASVTNPDDHYLVQAQLAVPGATLVTTDGDLCQAVNRAGLACITREEFLSNYL